jgi:DHA1 family solute carrier family 18 vesicular amine transporter 1/2
MQTPEQKRRSLFMLMLVQLSTNFSMGIISPILSLFIRSQGLSMTQIGLIGTASMLGWFIWEPIMGVITDRFNKRLLLAGSLTLTTLLYGVYPLANSFLSFAILEFIKTSVMSAYSIPVKSLAAELLPVQDRGRAYGRYTMIISFGGMISPLLGGYISELTSFSIPFYVASFFGLIGLITVFSIKYDEQFKEIISDNSKSIRDMVSKSVLAIFSVRGIYFFNVGFAGSFLPIYLNESTRFAASESQIGTFFTILRLVGAIFRSIIGDLCDKLGNNLIISSSLLGIAVSYLGLIYLSGIYSMYLLGSLFGLCQAAADISMMLQLILIMPKEKSGLTMGLYSESENIGGLISTPTLGYLYHNFGAHVSIWLVILVMLIDSIYSYKVIVGKD